MELRSIRRSALAIPLLCIFCSAFFHLYQSPRENFKGCPDSLASDTPNAADFRRWRLWPRLISDYDALHGEYLFGFKLAMQIIWRNQNPKDCKQAKFIVAKGWSQGFGSETHILGVGLAIAIAMNRIYVINPDGPVPPTDPLDMDNRWVVNNTFCRKQKKKTLECYYERWTHCSIEDIMGNQSMANLRTLGEKEFVGDGGLWKSDLPEKTVALSNDADMMNFVPPVFFPLLRCSPIRNSSYFYWWRAVSAAFLLRPNRATLRAIEQYRNRRVQDKTINIDYNNEKCISVHVRKGDKHVEIGDNPDPSVQDYLRAVEIMYSKSLIYERNELTGSHAVTSYLNDSDRGVNKPAIFIGSEDPGVIDYATLWGKRNNWRVFYTNLFDRRSVTAYLNGTEMALARRQRRLRHDENEYFSMILNLDYHLRCNAFVCMQFSNFCRVIDELRATVAAKANRHLLDISGRCFNCIDKDVDLGW